MSNIVKAEYFINNDPGFGNATDIPITPGVDVQNVVFNSALDTLPAGLHQLYLRSKNAAGKWSVTNRFVFYRATGAMSNIVQAEYFFNNDPGFGNATDIPITPGVNVQNIVFNAALNTLPAGVNEMFLRSKNSAGKWSITNRFSFNLFDIGDTVAAIICKPGTLVVKTGSTGSFLAGNNLIAELSDAAGSFAAPTATATIAFSGIVINQPNTINLPIPGSLPDGIGYRVRVRSTSPVFVGDTTGNITVSSPLSAVVSGTLTICSGNTASITVAVSGGTGPFTGTLSNGTPFSGTAPATVTISGLGGGTYSVATLTNGICPSPPGNLTGSAVITQPNGPTPGLWTGLVSTDWFDCRNWASGTVPGYSDDVVIQAIGISQRDCSIDPATSFADGAIAAVKNITINRPLNFVNGAQLNVSGNWYLGATGSVTVGTGTVNFNGTALQTINAGVAGPLHFYNLTINNTLNAGTANEVTLNKPVNVSGVLTLAQGSILSTTANVLTITNTTTGGVLGGSAASYVNGPIVRAMNTTNEYLFPVGKPGSSYENYRPSAVIPKTAGSLSFRAEYFNATFPDPTGYLDVIAGLVKTEWWQIDRIGGGVNDSAKVKLLYITPTGGSSDWAGPPPPDNNYAISIIKHSGTGNGSGGGNWYFTPNYTANQNSGFAVTGPEPETIPWFSQTGTPVYSKYISDFSPFGFGYAFYKLLPIRLVSFTGAIENKQALLNWTVADNAEVKSFTVEHSTNGSSFTGVGEVPKGSTASYKFYHNGLLPGANYYRLVMHGKDGTKIYSNVVVLNHGSVTTSITGIKPTLVRETTYVTVISAKNQNMHTRIFDTNGRLVRTEKTTMHQGLNTVPVLTENLANAMYSIVVLTDDGVQATFKIIKE
jgi:hypothetical protein